MNQGEDLLFITVTIFRLLSRNYDVFKICQVFSLKFFSGLQMINALGNPRISCSVKIEAMS